MKRFSFSSLRIRLILLVLLAVVPSLGIILYTGLEQRRRAAIEVKAEALRLVRFVSIEEQQSVEGVRQLLFALAQLPSLRSGDAASCNNLFTNLLKKYPRFANIGAANKDGHIFSSAIPLSGPVNAADRTWFQRAVQTRDFSVGDYQIGRITGKASVNFGYPVFDAMGQTQAVVFAALDLSWFNQLAPETQLPKGTVFTVVGSDGTILVRHPDPDKSVGRSMPEAPVIQAILKKGEGMAEIPGVDGITRLYAFTPLGRGNSNAYVSIGISKEAAFAAVDRVFGQSLLALCLVAVLALAAAWFMGDVLVLRGMNALLGATGQVAAGDLSARTGLSYGSGELSQLSRAFDQMAESLEKREFEARQITEENVVMARIGQLLGSTLRIEEVYCRFAEEARKLIPFDRINVNIINHDGKTATRAYSSGSTLTGRQVGEVFDLAGSSTEEVMRTRSSLLIQTENRAELADRFPRLLPAFDAGHRSMLTVPLISKNLVIGGLFLGATKPGVYTDRDVKLAENIGALIAGAIANAQLFTEGKQAGERVLRQSTMLEGINRILRETLTSEDEREIACTCLTAAEKLTGSKLGFISEVNEAGRLDTIALSHFGRDACKVPESQALKMLKDMEIRSYWGRVIREGRSQVVNDPGSDPDRVGTPEGHPRITSFLGVPLKHGERTFGLIGLGNKESGYDLADQQDIETLSIAFVEALDRKRENKEKERLQDHLRQSQKMEAIGRLAGGIAHDFNNLLTIIKGYSQLSLLELKEGDPLRGIMEEIQNASQRAADLTRQLLVFSRRQVSDVKVLDINVRLRDLDKMLRRVIGEDVELLTLLAEDLGRVKADPGQIDQVIMNLAVNARDAMPSGGKLTIETRNAELDEFYARRHVAVTPGHYVMISVSDTGVGMTPEVRERAFEPFFTTKEKGKGTGLGLSTVYGIVKQSGGNIWVYSEPGKGTVIKIYLPRIDEPLEEMRERVVTEELPRGSETILVVEDEEEVRKLIVRLLQRQGYNVLQARDGDDASLIGGQHLDPIHLILTDVVMPGMNGRALSERLTILHPKMKVLFMSGYAENAIVRHGVLAQGMNYLQKPFRMDELIRRVREVLDQ